MISCSITLSNMGRDAIADLDRYAALSRKHKTQRTVPPFVKRCTRFPVFASRTRHGAFRARLPQTHLQSNKIR